MIELNTSLQLPAFKLETALTYREVEKPSGPTFMLMVLFSELSDQKKYLSETLLEFGIHASLHDMMAQELKQLIHDEIVKIDGIKTFHEQRFDTYFLRDFTLTDYGAKLLRKKLIPTNREYRFEKDLYYIVPTQALSLHLDDVQEIRRVLPETLFKRKKLPNEKGLRDMVGAYENKTVNPKLSKSDELKALELPEDNIRYVQYKHPASLIIDHEGKVDIGFKEKALDAFLETHYSAELLQTLLAEKKKFKFKEKVPLSKSAKTIKAFKNIQALHLPEDVRKGINENTLVLCGGLNVETPMAVRHTSIQKGLNAMQGGVCALLWDEKGMRLRVVSVLSLKHMRTEDSMRLNAVLDLEPDDTQKTRILSLLDNVLIESAHDKNTWAVAQKADALLNSERFVHALFQSTNENGTLQGMIKTLEAHPDIFKNYTFVQKEANTKIETLLKDLSDKNAHKIPQDLAKLLPYVKEDKKTLTKRMLDHYTPGDDDQALMYFQALNEAGFTDQKVFDTLQVASILLQRIADTLPIESMDAKDAAPFLTFSSKLGRFRDALEMATPEDYRIPFESIDWKAFKKDFRELDKAFKTIKAYKDSNKKTFNTLLRYVRTIESVHDQLRLHHEEKTLSKMTPKAFSTYASNHPKDFIYHFHQRIEKVIKKKYRKSDEVPYFQLLERLSKESDYGEEDLNLLHELRKVRNDLVHKGELKRIPHETSKRAIEILLQLEAEQ